MSAQLDPAKRYAAHPDAVAPAASSSGNSGSLVGANGGAGGSSKARSPPSTPSPPDGPAALSPLRRAWLAEGTGETSKTK